MDLSDLLTPATNLVEVYFCPNPIHQDSATKQVGWEKEKKLSPKFGKGNTFHLYEYFLNDMCYSYDLKDDIQKGVRKIMEKQYCKDKGYLYAVSFNEEVIPSHMFPCTDDMCHEQKLCRTFYRINNRMFLIHDECDNFHYYYIRYQHVENVDLPKMQMDLSRVISQWREA
jgi:hypothetical protein